MFHTPIFDVIIIDGENRFECAVESINKLKEDGFIILDNSDWLPETSKLLRENDLIEINIDTINQKTYVFGIAHNEDEKKEIIQEAKEIVDLKELVTSILLVSDLSRQKE